MREAGKMAAMGNGINLNYNRQPSVSAREEMS